MKKTISILIAICMLVILSACGAKDQGPVAYVTIVGPSGLEVAASPVKLVDLNNDGTINVDDVLKEAHIEYNTNKDSAYSSADAGFGVSITKLWGDESGAYGYYINNTMLMNLENEVKENDYICAYVYKDQTGWSDSYAWFDKISASGDVELTLSAYTAFDENFNQVEAKIEGAHITVDGKATEITTNKDGYAKISGLSKGQHTISATHESYILNYPVCVVTVK